MMAVVSTVQLQGKPFLIGTLYRADGTIVRGAATSLEGERRALLRSLAKYLADGTAGPTLNIEGFSRIGPNSRAELIGPLPDALICKETPETIPVERRSS